MYTSHQQRTLSKGYLAVLDRERQRQPEQSEYVETSALTITFEVAGSHAYYVNLIRQALKNYVGIHNITVLEDLPVSQPAKDHLTVHQAARSTGYSVHQITRWLRDGHWTGSKVDGHWQIDLDSSFSRPPRRQRH